MAGELDIHHAVEKHGCISLENPAKRIFHYDESAAGLKHPYGFAQKSAV